MIAENDVIDIPILLQNKETYQIIDLQSDYKRELNGYLAQSVLVPEDGNPKFYIKWVKKSITIKGSNKAFLDVYDFLSCLVVFKMKKPKRKKKGFRLKI